MQIPYRYYDFNWPPVITEPDYNGLKGKLAVDPALKLVNEPSFYEKYKWGIWIAAISTALTIILIFISRFQWDIPGEIKFRILGIAIVADFFILLSLFGLAGGATYLWYIFQRNLYYRRMKRALIESINYKDFLEGFYKRYYRNQYPFV